MSPPSHTELFAWFGKQNNLLKLVLYSISQTPYRILHISPWCIIHPPPSSAESYVGGYLPTLYRGTAPCTGNDNSRQVIVFSHVDGFENRQFWNFSLDCQLRLSIGKFSLQKLFSWYIFAVHSIHNLFNGWRLQYEQEAGVADCNAVAVRSSRRSGIYLRRFGCVCGNLFVDHRCINVFIRMLTRSLLARSYSLEHPDIHF